MQPNWIANDLYFLKFRIVYKHFVARLECRHIKLQSSFLFCSLFRKRMQRNTKYGYKYYNPDIIYKSYYALNYKVATALLNFNYNHMLTFLIYEFNYEIKNQVLILLSNDRKYLTSIMEQSISGFNYGIIKWCLTILKQT